MDQTPDPISKLPRGAHSAPPAGARAADERAEIVELSVVGHGRASRIQVIAVAAGGIAILALALAGLNAAPLNEVDASASAGSVLPSASPDRMPGASTPRPSARPPATAPPLRTPRPGQWAVTVVPGLAAEFSIVESIWALPDVFIANVVMHSSFGEPTNALVGSSDGLDWQPIAGPPGLVIRVGSVLERRLWVIGRRGSPDDPAWEIWSTADGREWRQRTGVRGLTDHWTDITRLAAGPLGWIVAGYVEVHDPQDDSIRAHAEVRYARDGLSWRPVELPGAESHYFVTAVVSDGERWVMVGIGPGLDDQTVVTTAWVSGDGESWTARVVATMNGSATALTWGPQGFVLVGIEGLDFGVEPRAWVSVDGLSWSYMGIEQPGGGTSGGMVQVAATSRGYLAIGESSDAWLSIDGATWQRLDVFPGASDLFTSSIAIRDDLVLVGTATSQSEAVIWRGDLARLP